MKRLVSAFILFPIFLSGCESVAVAPAPLVSGPPVVTKQASAPTATAGVLEITRVTSDAAPELIPRVSPDKKSILITVRDTRKNGLEGLSIVSLKLNSPGRRLVAGPYASGGTWLGTDQIVYTYLRANPVVLVRQSLDANGMRFLNPSAYGENDQLASFSEAANKFVFQTTVGGVLHIATVARDGRDYTVFVEGQYPSWSADGKTIFFQKRVGAYFQIFTLDLKRGGVTQITSNQFNSSHAAISPSNKLIAFISDKDGSNHIYIMNTDGSNLLQITSGNTQEAFPDWLGNNELVFSSDAGAESANKSSPFAWEYSNIWKLKLSN